MSDFFQNGVITTLHSLRDQPTEKLEKELINFSELRPMSLVLPCLYSELEGPAMANIVDELTKVPYLTEIIIGLDRASKSQFKKAREYFKRLPQYHRILWNDGDNMKALNAMLNVKGLGDHPPGKGKNVWTCFGYFLASNRGKAVALHDCDILTYKRDMLARLFYPIANPAFTYKFCKGFYYRADDEKFNGRVARLLVTPLIHALRHVMGNDSFLDYIASFRYPLAGEFSMMFDVVHAIHIPSDWGLEIGVLSEVNRHYTTQRICQVDIAGQYDHKHQDLSPDDPNDGLSKMSIDISKAIFKKLAIKGKVFSSDFFRTLKAAYYRSALDFVEQYYCDAVYNGYKLDRHAESKAVELFAKSIVDAGEHFLNNPMETPSMPSWARVTSALPDYFERLKEVVEEDNK